jgi:pre-mRNA-splicing factor RBM22/SLT11
MLDLSFGLPIVVRDAALKMVAPGPESSVNREYFAQNNEKELEEGRGGLEAYEKTDEKARELLRRLANSEPYQRKQRRLEAEAGEEGSSEAGQKRIAAAPGPTRTQDSKPSGSNPYTRSPAARGGRGGARVGRPGAGLPRPEDIAPPRDPNITSLFVTGVEDDLPEYMIRKHFAAFGTLRSVICSHRAHSAFVNYASRDAAESAAEACQGRAVIAGVPLRVRWGKPKPLDSMEEDERMMLARQGRETAAALKATDGRGKGKAVADPEQEAEDAEAALAPPPGQEEIQYASLAGD